MIRKGLFSLALLTISMIALGQGAKTEINEQVWKPFIKTLLSHDVEGFMNLHSKDVMRGHMLNFDQ